MATHEAVHTIKYVLNHGLFILKGVWKDFHHYYFEITYKHIITTKCWRSDLGFSSNANVTVWFGVLKQSLKSSGRSVSSWSGHRFWSCLRINWKCIINQSLNFNGLWFVKMGSQWTEEDPTALVSGAKGKTIQINVFPESSLSHLKTGIQSLGK